MKYSYSLDEEHYTGQYDSVESAEECGFNDNPDYDSLWIGENRVMTAHDFINPCYILDTMSESAGDECGESSEGWLDVIYNSKEKKHELVKIIGDWIEANAPVKFWTVDNVVRINRDEQ